VATDVPRAQQILRGSPGVPAPLVERVGRLRTTPVVVVRLWFEQGTAAPDVETIVLPAPVFGDVYFGLNAIDRSHDAEGVVVELQCCVAEDRWIDATDEEILDAVFRDLATLPGELTRDRLRSPDAWVIQRHASVFTRYSPGDSRHRPRAATGVAGLHVCGDWTAAEWSVWMMERAVVSGLRAANRVLASRGLPAIDIARLEPDGLLLAVSRRIARAARWLLADDLSAPRADEDARRVPESPAAARSNGAAPAERGVERDVEPPPSDRPEA
jgi:isorenieratene synthase